MQPIDLFHPMATFHMETCSVCMPCDCSEEDFIFINTLPACVLLKDKIFVADNGPQRQLYVTSIDLKSWTKVGTLTPTYKYGLTTYDSQLAIVGGLAGNSDSYTNKIWLSADGQDWKQTLPSMATKRILSTALSAKDCLIVMGGMVEKGPHYLPYSSIVEVFIHQHWVTIQPLPPGGWLQSTIHNGILFVSRGFGENSYCKVTSLITHASQSALKRVLKKEKLWKKFDIHGAPLIPFHDLLLAVGANSTCGYIHAYSPDSQSWAHVADLPTGHCLHIGDAWALPTGEVILMGGCKADKDLHPSFAVHKLSPRSK